MHLELISPVFNFIIRCRATSSIVVSDRVERSGMMKFIMLAQGIGITVGGGSEEKFGGDFRSGTF
jgi:hypothetical protein